MLLTWLIALVTNVGPRPSGFQGRVLKGVTTSEGGVMVRWGMERGT